MATLANDSSPTLADLTEEVRLLVARQIRTAACFVDLAIRSRALIEESHELVARANATLYGDQRRSVREGPNRR